MTNLSIELPSLENFSFLAQANTLNVPVEGTHTLALSNLQNTIKKAFAAQAKELELLKQENIDLRRRLNDLTITHERELESQKAVASAAITSLQSEVKELAYQRNELFKIAKKAPETVANVFDLWADRNITGKYSLIEKTCDDAAFLIRNRMDWKPYLESVDLLVNPKKL